MRTASPNKRWNNLRHISRASSLGWQRTHCRIITKAATLVWLTHNRDQLKLYNTMQLQANRSLPVRLIVLKARRLGMSTGVAATVFEKCNRRPNRFATVVSADEDATNKVFRMYRTFQQEIPLDDRRETEYCSRREIVYTEPHRSSILCQTAGKQILGRGGLTHYLHLSEVAFWSETKERMAGLLNEVPDKPGTIVVWESTASGVGGRFHELYWEAVDWLRHHPGDYTGYLPVFLPWHTSAEYRREVPPEAKDDQGRLRLIDEEPFVERETRRMLADRGVQLDDEQLMWRRLKIRNDLNMDLSLFRQEFPSTALEAFQATGRMIYAGSVLDRHETRCCAPMAYIAFDKDEDGRVSPETVLRRDNCWKIWRWPQANHDYVLYGDVAEGILADRDDPKSDPDYHAAGILDRNTYELVATFHGRCDTIPYGQQMDRAGRFYNNAWASPEANSMGLAPLNELKREHYPRIYQRQSKEEEHAEKITAKLGYKVTSLNRKPALEMLRKVLTDMDLVIYDRHVIEELRVFINNNGKWEAAKGYHDDWVMMLMGLIQLHLLCPLGGHIEQRNTADRPGEEPRPAYAASAAGGVEYDDEADLDMDDGEVLY